MNGSDLKNSPDGKGYCWEQGLHFKAVWKLAVLSRLKTEFIKPFLSIIGMMVFQTFLEMLALVELNKLKCQKYGDSMLQGRYYSFRRSHSVMGSDWCWTKKGIRETIAYKMFPSFGPKFVFDIYGNWTEFGRNGIIDGFPELRVCPVHEASLR